LPSVLPWTFGEHHRLASHCREEFEMIGDGVELLAGAPAAS
jgi:hypothetical protein